MINNNLKILITTAIIMMTFVGCKKSENDPFLSLRSRDARITGEWVLTNLTGNSKEVEKNPSFTSIKTKTTSFANYIITTVSNFTTVYASGGDTTTNSYTTNDYLNRTITINKDGSFEFTDISEKGVKNVVIGTWSWTNSKKNKTGIIFKSSIGNEDYIINMLKNNELVLEMSENSSTTDDINGTLLSFESTFLITYTK